MPVSLVVRRRAAVALRAALVFLALARGGATIGAQQTPGIPRIRTTEPLIAAAIALGAERSTTFRRLTEAIGATDGLVYVEDGKCGDGTVRACLHMSLTVSGPNRLLHILVNPRRAPGCELTSSIAHELQHAWEVLTNPSVRSTPAMVSFLERIGPTGSGRFETTEAKRVGLAVEKEVCRRSAVGQ